MKRKENEMVESSEEVLDCIEPYSKVHFRSSKRDIEKAISNFDSDLRNYRKVTYTGFLDYLESDNEWDGILK